MSSPIPAQDSGTRGGRVCYGLTLTGLAQVRELNHGIGSAGEATTLVSVRQRDEPPPALRDQDGDQVVRRLSDGHVLQAGRRSGSAVLYGPPVEPDVLAHPLLAPIAVTFNRWRGREAFHAGAFTSGGRAWIVVGGRTAGKSTLLAALAGEGVDVLADDIVITDGESVFAGPRCIDLREPIPGVELAVQPSRSQTRFRLGLPDVPHRVPLGGWIFLRWDRAPTIRTVGPSDLLRRVANRRLQPFLPSDPTLLLNLGTRPAWDLYRPVDWACLSTTVDLIRAATSARVRARP